MFLAELDTISLFGAFCHYACEQKIDDHALYDCTKCFKKENDTNYRFEIFYACAVIVTLQSAKTPLLAWHYFGRRS